MQINLEVNNVTKSPYKKGFFKMVVEKTFAEINCDFLKSREIEISIALVKPAEIRKINNKYRGYNSATDILSFSQYNSAEDLKKHMQKNKGKPVFLGELILCYDDIIKYVQKERLDLEREFTKVVAHGILHLLGFKHGEKMLLLQQSVADKFIK